MASQEGHSLPYSQRNTLNHEVSHNVSMGVHAKVLQWCLTLAAPWTVAHQAPLSMNFPRQEYWSGLPCPPVGDLPHSGIEPKSLVFPALASRFFTTSVTQEALCTYNIMLYLFNIHNMNLMRGEILGARVLGVNEHVSAVYKGHCLAVCFYISSICLTGNGSFELAAICSVSWDPKHRRIYFLILFSDTFQFHMSALSPAKRSL